MAFREKMRAALLPDAMKRMAKYAFDLSYALNISVLVEALHGMAWLGERLFLV